MSWETIGSSFALVAASEIGDKTQLLAFSLAGRFRRPWSVLAGILVATLASCALASALGAWIAAHVPPRVMAGIVAAAFIGFGIWALRPDTCEECDKPSRFGPFLTTTLLFLIAEMGDKTQLATLALGARFGSAMLVTIGTTAGMLAADGIAVILGEKLAAKVQRRWPRFCTAGLFFVFGLASAWRAVRG
ncbi:MAG: TMEM165/GDT1 family protein [Deltaproteobacteria bacterium]|jgi:putative Ca2+/H+ antiporter (TMEM165/GDT1 family)|nr:TMEM165/GDT1 family protein [Deltaproteobacteria bacterium]